MRSLSLRSLWDVFTDIACNWQLTIVIDEFKVLTILWKFSIFVHNGKMFTHVIEPNRSLFRTKYKQVLLNFVRGNTLKRHISIGKTYLRLWMQTAQFSQNYLWQPTYKAHTSIMINDLLLLLFVKQTYISGTIEKYPLQTFVLCARRRRWVNRKILFTTTTNIVRCISITIHEMRIWLVRLLRLRLI